jgi:AcrR family transcriptional regulator
LTRPDYRDYRLPRGPHGLPPEEVSANQRWRLIGAAAELFRATGEVPPARAATVLAGVSSRTFYDHFSSGDELNGAAVEAAANATRKAAATGCRNAECRKAKLREGLEAVVEWQLAEPAQAAMLGLGMAVAVPAAASARADLTGWLAAAMQGVTADRTIRLSARTAGIIAIAALDLLIAADGHAASEGTTVLLELVLGPSE